VRAAVSIGHGANIVTLPEETGKTKRLLKPKGILATRQAKVIVELLREEETLNQIAANGNMSSWKMPHLYSIITPMRPIN
jgi:hypothetical protein